MTGFLAPTFKLGLYGPIKTLLGLGAFVGVNVGPLELGYAPEPVFYSYTFYGKDAQGTRVAHTGMAGARYPINAIWDGSIGLKAPFDDMRLRSAAVYAAVSLKLGLAAREVKQSAQIEGLFQ